jgi:hypothetical protein
VPLIVIQPQLGHSNPGMTSINRPGIDSAEIVDDVRWRAPWPMVRVSASQRP